MVRSVAVASTTIASTAEPKRKTPVNARPVRNRRRERRVTHAMAAIVPAAIPPMKAYQAQALNVVRAPFCWYAHPTRAHITAASTPAAARPPRTPRGPFRTVRSVRTRAEARPASTATPATHVLVRAASGALRSRAVTIPVPIPKTPRTPSRHGHRARGDVQEPVIPRRLGVAHLGCHASAYAAGRPKWTRPLDLPTS
nr:hypothetical protein GCM10020092_074390 [Actinoplanes digitatis]